MRQFISWGATWFCILPSGMSSATIVVTDAQLGVLMRTRVEKSSQQEMHALPAPQVASDVSFTGRGIPVVVLSDRSVRRGRNKLFVHCATVTTTSVTRQVWVDDERLPLVIISSSSSTACSLRGICWWDRCRCGCAYSRRRVMFSCLFDVDASFDCGSYGSVHRGTWSKGATGGKGAKLVIKCLLVNDEEAKESFFKEMNVWRQLDHPHVLKLYGACHVSSPALFVCDDAAHGSFGEFVEEDKSHLWRLFYEAALGLGYLHAKRVVHGDLKCNNILVGGDYNAKLCYFGFSCVRSQSVGLSAKSQTETIRWKAPECLMSSNEDRNPQFNPRFASDVYSLGMSIIEAFLGEAPYGIMDDDEIMLVLFEEKPYPCPGDMKDDERALVESLVHLNWKERISLPDAIDKLKMFADREEEERAVEAEARECSACEASMAIEFAFCGRCGTSMTKAVEQNEAVTAAQEKNTCPRCEGNVLSTDRFCRHWGYCLGSDPAFD